MGKVSSRGGKRANIYLCRVRADRRHCEATSEDFKPKSCCNLTACIPENKSFVLPLHHQEDYLLTGSLPIVQITAAAACMFLPSFGFLSSREMKWPQKHFTEPPFYSFLSSHTRDLSRLTATYFSCGHFSNASPAQRLNTRPTSRSTGAFLFSFFFIKTAPRPSLAAWWL